MSVGSFIYVGAGFPASVCIWCMFHQSMAFSDWYLVDLVGMAQQQLSFLLSGFSVWLQMRSNRANCQALWLEPKYANYIHVWNQPMHANIEKHATKWPTGPSTVSCLITVAMQRKLQLHLNWSKGTGMMSGLQRDICILHRGCEQRYEIHPKGPNHTWMVRGMVDNGEHPHGKNVRHPEEVQSCHPGCLWKFHEGCCATRGPKFSMQSCHHSKRVSDFPHVFFVQFIQRWIRWSEWIWQHMCFLVPKQDDNCHYWILFGRYISMIFLQGINDTASTMGW